MTETTEDKKIKSFEDDLLARATKLMDDIEGIKEVICENRFALPYYSQKVRSLFMVMSRKMNEEDKKTQRNYNTEINKIKLIRETTHDLNGNLLSYTGKPVKIIRSSDYTQFKTLVEEREEHLFSIIEKLSKKKRFT